jgi:hypothetical protein
MHRRSYMYVRREESLLVWPDVCCQECFALLSALRGVVWVCYLAYEGRFGWFANIYLRYEGFLAYVALIAGCWNSAVQVPPICAFPLFWRFRQPLVTQIDVCNRPKPPLVTQIGMLEALRPRASSFIMWHLDGRRALCAAGCG